jgi:hypothetical protein
MVFPGSIKKNWLLMEDADSASDTIVVEYDDWFGTTDAAASLLRLRNLPTDDLYGTGMMESQWRVLQGEL